MTKTLPRLVALTLAVAAITGCGGGGDSPAPAPIAGTPAPSPAPAPAPTPSVAGAPQTDPGVVTYAADLRAAFDYVNAERTRAGLGVLMQSTQLDAAAAGHAQYLQTNRATSHVQTAGLPGFTGVTPQDRANLAGYAGSAVEVVAPATASGPLLAVRGLISAPYHRAGLLDAGARRMGLGVAGPEYTVGLTGDVSGLPVQDMLTAAAGVSVYPADGSTGTDLVMTPEVPDPVPELAAGAFAGASLTVQVARTKVLEVTTFTVTNVGTGAPVAVKVLGRSDPGYVSLGIRNWIAAVPLAPLAPSTVYEARFVGTVDGLPLSRTWRFTTRSADASAMTVGAATRNGSVITFTTTTPSGLMATTGGAYQLFGCGAGYAVQPAVNAGSQVWSFTETGPRAQAGCTVSVTWADAAVPTLRRTVAVPVPQ